MTKTVTIAATRTNGDPYAHHDVIVTLVAGSAGGVVGSNVIVSQTKVPLNASGQGSIVLATNDVEITSPSTSFYRFTVDGSSPTITRSVRITDALPSTISWTRSGIEVGDPTIPQRDVSSDYVQVGDQSLTNYLADLETGGGGPGLGETSTTAYRGDRGKTAYDHSQVTSGNPHGVTAADVGAAPTSRTITAGTGLTGGGSLASDRTLAVDAATLARIGATVETTSDSTARTSTTYTADGTLQFDGAADTTYRIDAYLIFQGDASADLKVGFTTPAGTMHLTVEGGLITVASGTDYDRFLTLTSSGATTVVGIAGASTPIAVRISGVIRLTSAGTVSFGWAPNATGAGTGVTRLARSQLYYRAA